MATSEVRSSHRQAVGPGRAQLWLAIAALLAVTGLGSYLYTAYTPKQVTIVIDGEEALVLDVVARTVGQALQRAGISLREGDEVWPALYQALVDGTRIEIARGVRVTLRVDGQELEVAVPQGTVRDALVKAGIRMGPLDRVVPVRETRLEEGMEIRVIRVTQEEVVETETIPYRTLRWAEPHLAKGEERIVREGREGLLETRVLLTYEDGQLVHRQILSTEVKVEPVNRIIGVGTRESLPVLQTATGSYRYVDVLDMEATAYYPGPESTGEWADGYTFTGLRAGKGVVAVDPSIIPLGTRLYVPGYGEAIAADIGGAIKGYRIDLGFDTYEEAIRYGRRKVKVYILAP